MTNLPTIQIKGGEIDSLISELQILSDRKFEESSDNPLHPSWIEAANNISTFIKK